MVEDVLSCLLAAVMLIGGLVVFVAGVAFCLYMLFTPVGLTVFFVAVILLGVAWVRGYGLPMLEARWDRWRAAK